MSQPPSMLCLGALYPPPHDRYKLLGIIGQGAFSEVWVALDRKPENGRPFIAVKCCKPTTSDQSSAEVKVLEEIRDKARGSRHPGAGHIMPLLDDFIVPASDPFRLGLFHQCIVTELVLSLSDDAFSEKIMGSLIRQITDAFDFLHSHRIIHGDPHIGNIGIEIGSLQGVTESAMVESLQGGRSTWLCTLQKLDTARQSRSPPDETHEMRVKILDFGRAYLVATGDSYGLPDRTLLGQNPVHNRPPEAEMFRVTGGKVGVSWSPYCDIWALGSMIVWKQEETGVVARCLVGGVPPAHWLNQYEMGDGLIEYLQDTDINRLPKNREKSSKDIKWVQEEMQFQHEKPWKDHWANITRKPLFADPKKFPFKEFFSMVKEMTKLDTNHRFDMGSVSSHDFWKLFEPAQCYDEW